MAERAKFSGTITALVTPLLKDGSVDYSALKGLVDYQLEQGIDGLSPCGTTGESATLTHEEQHRVIKVVVEQVGKRVPVIAGAGSNSTRTAVALARAAEEAGADAILSVTPYYNRPTQEGLFQHFRAIAESVRVPVIVYNVPGRTGCNLEPQTLMRLAEIRNVVGVKEASGNLGQIMEIIRQRPSGFAVLSGDDALALPIIAAGGDGVVSVVSNEAPGLMKQMVDAALAGDYEKARRLHYRLLPLMNANFIETNPIPVKAALAMMGLIQENYNLPLCAMRPENRDRLRRILEELELVK